MKRSEYTRQFGNPRPCAREGDFGIMRAIRAFSCSLAKRRESCVRFTAGSSRIFLFWDYGIEGLGTDNAAVCAAVWTENVV